MRIERHGVTVDLNLLQKAGERLTKGAKQGATTLAQVEDYREGPARALGREHADRQLQRLKAHPGFARLDIDWNQFEVLKTATPGELEAASQRLRALNKASDLYGIMAFAPAVRGTDLGPKLSEEQRQKAVAVREQLFHTIQVVKQGIAAAGECAATAKFPMATLDALQHIVAMDLYDLASQAPADPWGAGSTRLSP